MSRHLYVISLMAMNHLIPLFFPEDKRTIPDLINELDALTTQDSNLVNTSLFQAFAPFMSKNDGGVGLKVMKRAVEKCLVDRQIELDPEFQTALENIDANKL